MPFDVAATLERAVEHHRGGRHGEAASLYRRVLVDVPDQPVALHLLGLARQQENDLEGAATLMRRAVATVPEYAAARLNLGSVHQALGQFERAAAQLGGALCLTPSALPALTNLGNALYGLHRLDAAVCLHRRALRIDCGSAAAHGNLGTALLHRSGSTVAEAAFQRALVLEPQNADVWCSYGLAAKLNRRASAALKRYQRALTCAPHLADAHHNLGMLLLETGTLREGWAHSEWRFQTPQSRGSFRAVPRPLWRGQNISKQRLLVWREQGVGDELMFASCYADAIARAGSCIIECDPRLVGLFARSFPTARVRPVPLGPDGDTPFAPDSADVHAPAGSLPRLLRPSLAAFAGTPGFLRPDPARVALWRARLDTLGPAVTIGIAWRSQVMTTRRAGAYTRLDEWGAIFGVPGVRFVNLQYGDCTAELVDAEARFGVPLHRWADLDLKNDFEGTAALMANLDLVISGPTAVGELAGALGVPVWRIAPTDWTQLGSGVRPWFASMRLFQPRSGEALADALPRIARHLHRFRPKPA